MTAFVRVFLDDLRTIGMVYEDPDESSWVILRTFKDFDTFIRTNPCPNLISFDHDLGEDSPGVIAPSGMDCAKLLVELDLDGVISIPSDFTFVVHSSNPNGRANIESLLTGYMAFKYTKE